MAVLICVIMVSFLKTKIILSSLAPGTPFKAFDCSKIDDSIKSYGLYDVNQCGNFFLSFLEFSHCYNDKIKALCESYHQNKHGLEVFLKVL